MSHAARGLLFWFVYRYHLTHICLPLFTDAFPSSSTSAWGRCGDVLLQICCLFTFSSLGGNVHHLLQCLVNAQAVQSKSSSNAKAKYVFMTFLFTCAFILEHSWNLCFYVCLFFHHFIKPIILYLVVSHFLAEYLALNNLMVYIWGGKKINKFYAKYNVYFFSWKSLMFLNWYSTLLTAH